MTAEELRTRLRDARAELRSAIEAMSARWEEPCLPSEAPQVDPGAVDATWTPRQAVEHAILGQAFHFMLLVQSLYEFPRAEDALRALDDIAAAVDLVAQRVTDADLDRFARGIGEGQQRYLQQLGHEPNRDLRAVLQISAGHLGDHAQQLQKAARP